MIIKSVIAAVWIWSIASFFVMPESTGSWFGRGTFFLMLAAHILECLIFLRPLRKASGSLGGHLLQTLIFGIVHVRGLRR